MAPEKQASDSPWALNTDIFTAKILVWIAGLGREAELTPEAHQYFCDRYRRLAVCYRMRGNSRAAEKADAKASEHCSDDDGPPYAAAMAMPRPARLTKTNAAGTTRRPGPDDAA